MGAWSKRSLGAGNTQTAAETELLRRIDSKQSDLIELLATLVCFHTDNPPGNNESVAQGWIAQRLEKAKARVVVFDVLPKRPDTVGVLPGTGGGRSIILNGHIDVAEVRTREAWTHDPFDLDVQRRLAETRDNLVDLLQALH